MYWILVSYKGSKISKTREFYIEIWIPKHCCYIFFFFWSFCKWETTLPVNHDFLQVYLKLTWRLNFLIANIIQRKWYFDETGYFNKNHLSTHDVFWTYETVLISHCIVGMSYIDLGKRKNIVCADQCTFLNK